ncbi:PA1571 family protein [Kaarinaea lacus]
MKQNTNPRKAETQNLPGANFHGACIITESGKEIPITEQMLQKAFADLIKPWEQSRQHQQT